METNKALDSDFVFQGSKTEIAIVESNKVVLLYIFSFGLYEVWWTYKMWRFFKEKDSLDINPVARSIFAVFFTYSLFERIKGFAIKSGYQKNYSSGLLFWSSLLIGFLHNLPDPYWILSMTSGFFLIPVVNAFNYAITNSSEYIPVVRNGYSSRQMGIIAVGGICWILIIMDLLLPEQVIQSPF